MPYIKQEDRKNFNGLVAKLSKRIDFAGNNKGDLNYIITMLIKEFVKRKGLKYNTLSDITGVLNDVKVEFERKVVANYEDLKIKENGGIYEDLIK